MSAPPNPPRRIAPQLGPAAWSGAELPASEYMVPLGAEHAAEVQTAADASTPRLETLSGELEARLDHGLGVVLLRGLPVPADATAMLHRLGHRLGTSLPGEAERATTAFADVLLLQFPAAAELSLFSASAAHNALLAADRAALGRLYESSAPGGAPVFTVVGGVFAGHADPAVLPLPGDLPPALALRLSLQRGDVLALNPLLVWLHPEPAGATRLALRAAQSRMDAPGWVGLRGARPGDPPAPDLPAPDAPRSER